MTQPAGWYDDPTSRGRLRWWDGGSWTSHVAAPSPPTAAVATLEPAPSRPHPLPRATMPTPVAPRPAPPVPVPPPTRVDRPTPPAEAIPVPPAPVVVPLPSYLLPDETILDPAPPEEPRSRRSMLVSGAIALAVLLASLAGFAHWRSPRPAEVVAAALAAEAAARVVPPSGAGAVLDRFRPIAAGAGAWAPSAHGADLAVASLAGWCGRPGAAEADRMARRSWTMPGGGAARTVTVEAVAYTSTAAATAAIAGLEASTSACRAVVVRTPAGRTAFTRLSGAPFVPPVVLARGLQAQVRETASVVRTGSTATSYTWLSAQQRGQFVTVLRVHGAAPVTGADLASLGGLVHRQSVALAASPMP